MGYPYCSLIWVLYLMASMAANTRVEIFRKDNTITGIDFSTTQVEARVWETYYNRSNILTSQPNWGVLKEVPRKALGESAVPTQFGVAGHYNETEAFMTMTQGSFNERRRVSIELFICQRRSGCGTDDSYYQSKNWMGKIPGTTPLYRMSIPGTHDSGALYPGNGGPFSAGVVKCQSMDISTQLSQGVRAFDIRNRHISNVFAIHHGSVFQKMFFGDVVVAMTNFLNQNPSETIIVRHKEEHDPKGNTRKYHETMDWYIRRYPKLHKIKYWKDVREFTLEKARGKILINWYRLMEDKKGENWSEIEDDWDIGSCKKRHEKWRKISWLIDRARQNPKEKKLYVSFTSASGGSNVYNPFKSCGLSISEQARFQNEKLFTKLGRIFGENQPRIGIIFMDFPGPRLISLIIKQNTFFCRKLQHASLDSRNVVTRCGTKEPLRSGDTIALRSMCATRGWISNWCTKNCGEISRPRSCPGTRFERHEIRRCGGEALIIVAEGRGRGENIRSGDIIGLYYGGGYWMSCQGYKKNCKTRPCPGSISNYKNSGWRWNTGCHWEMFRIKFSTKIHNGATIYNGDEVVIQRETPGRSGCSHPSDWYLSEEGRRITLRNCPGCSNGNIRRRCRCEAFQLTTFGRYYGMG